MSAHPVAMSLAKIGRDQREQAAAMEALRQAVDSMAASLERVKAEVAEMKERTEGDGR